jgi:hypothetical protein
MAKRKTRKAPVRFTGEMDEWFVSVGLMAIVLGILVLAITVY